MGGGQSSSRKVTLENPNETVTEITDGVIDRLHGADKSAEMQPESSAVSSSPSPNSASNAVTFVSSQEIRRQVNKVLEENDSFWESRMKILRDGYQKIGVELEAEYNRVTKDVDHSLGIHLAGGGAAVHAHSCRSSQTAVVDCYSQNKGRPLLCAHEVQKFNECVSNSFRCVKAK